MKRLTLILTVLGSKATTVWLAGVFILYYLALAIWSKEAFSRIIAGLAGNVLIQSLYVLFFLNAAYRTARRMKEELSSRARFALRLPLYAGTLLFLAMFFLSLNTRHSRWQLVGEGDPVKLYRTGEEYRVSRITSALQIKALRTEGSAIFDYEPALTIVDRTGRQHHITAFPPVKVGSTYLHVLNFGIGPGVELRRAGETLSKGYMALRLTPFGSVDVFELPSFPYRFSLAILPNRTGAAGSALEREYDLARPKYRVEVERGGKVIARGETDSSLRFEEEMSIHFDKPSDWILLEAVRDPFYPGYAASLVLLLGGAFLYPFSYLVKRRSPVLP